MSLTLKTSLCSINMRGLKRIADRNPGNAMPNVRKPGLFFHGMAKWTWRKVPLIFGQY